MAITLKDIADKVGVHPSTVSRILRGTGDLNITAETRDRVKSVAQELDYQPNELARAFRLKKTHTIGLIIPDISNSFFAGVARSIEIESYQAGYNLLVCNTDEDAEREIQFSKNLINRGVDGLIIAPSQNAKEFIVDLKQKKIPFVLIDRNFENIDSNAIISNNRESAYNAIKYLANLGHKRIGFISGLPNLSTIKNRLDGYKNAVGDFGLDSGSELIVGDSFTFESGYQSVIEILSLTKPPTALLISGNILTIGAIKAILKKNLSIPDDISVIGYTDSKSAPYLVSPLATVSHPLEEFGKQAFKLLLKNIKKPKSRLSSKIVIETIFNPRGSIAPPKR